jgi:cell wall assembly regulator SMI1
MTRREPQPHDLALRLRGYWQSIDLKVRPGVSEGDIEAFEAAHYVSVPEELRTYLMTVDGMDESDSDMELLEWMSLDRIQRVTDELAHFGGTPDYRGIVDTLEEPGDWYVFINYLISSHVYAIRMTPAPCATAPVIWIWGSEHRQMANSLSEFLDAYLADPQSILFPDDL